MMLKLFFAIILFILPDISLSKELSPSQTRTLVTTNQKTAEKSHVQKLYKEKEIQSQQNTNNASGEQQANFDKLQAASHEDLTTIIVLLGEIPVSNKTSIFVPAILYNKNNIFNTNTDFSFSWVGLKSTAKFTQKKFIWEGTSLQETFIGSFLYASGTNFGFFGQRFNEDLLFYTNYISEIITLRISLPFYSIVGLTLDSRQYFFIKRNIPSDFIMPKNHFNLFPRIDLNLEHYNEQGIDQIFTGILWQNWIGYGWRNKWDAWGKPNALQMGKKAKTFVIYSSTLTYGTVFNARNNFIFRIKVKGGIDNDFLSQPRFGGTIDNAKIDVVHGTTVDQFRVNSFSLINVIYGFDICSLLRTNLYADFAYIISPPKTYILGTGYGWRIRGPLGIPFWFTHGISVNLSHNYTVEQVIMIMSAAGF